MGWTSYCAKHYYRNGRVNVKAELDEELTWNTNEPNGWDVIKSVVVGSVYYGAIKHRTDGKITAVVCLTSSKYIDGANFGYKDMTEDMCPCESNCPKSILNLLTPTDNEYANKWRQECWENVKKNAELKKAKSDLQAETALEKLTVVPKNIECIKSVFSDRIVFTIGNKNTDNPLRKSYFVSKRVYCKQLLTTNFKEMALKQYLNISTPS